MLQKGQRFQIEEICIRNINFLGFWVKSISETQKPWKFFWYLDIPISLQSFWENQIIKCSFIAARWSGKRKFDVFHLFHFKESFCILCHNSKRKMLSFEAHYDFIAKEITKWEGHFLSQNCHFSHPLILLFFEGVYKTRIHCEARILKKVNFCFSTSSCSRKRSVY